METRVRHIPEQLWREFKSMCALEAITMNDMLIKLMQQAVEQHKKGKS
ncbi:hypothetical protein ES708_26836 [subsurface metagenome]